MSVVGQDISFEDKPVAFELGILSTTLGEIPRFSNDVLGIDELTSDYAFLVRLTDFLGR